MSLYALMLFLPPSRESFGVGASWQKISFGKKGAKRKNFIVSEHFLGHHFGLFHKMWVYLFWDWQISSWGQVVRLTHFDFFLQCCQWNQAYIGLMHFLLHTWWCLLQGRRFLLHYNISNMSRVIQINIHMIFYEFFRVGLAKRSFFIQLFLNCPFHWAIICSN